MTLQLLLIVTKVLTIVKNGICTLDRKMTSFRQFENIIAL